jgi:hypothetical protein
MEADASRFYDAETGKAMQLQFQQTGACFKLIRQFGYRDPRYDEPFVVPADTKTFETDLASIPPMFAWLVPGLGSHLPAVLVHDGLVLKENECKTHKGPDVDREEADRILRDAMASLGVPRIRRWMMWAAVIQATAWHALRPRAWWRTLVIVTPSIIGLLGAIATLDLMDVWDVLPWMNDRTGWVELASGFLFALLIPLAISVLWGRLWAAAAIEGVALAFLLHVTAVIVVLYRLYLIAEGAISKPEGNRAVARESFEDAVAGVSEAAER